MAEIRVQITADTKKFLNDSKDVVRASATLEKSFTRLGSVAANALSSFAGNLGAAAVVGGFRAIGNAVTGTVQQFGEFIDAAQVQEDAINRLNTALATSGDFSIEASRQFQRFASQLQQTTRFGDEVILNQIALAKSFGASNEQAQQVVEAAADLSAAFGIDLESATRNVAKTLGGYAGELGEVIPALKELGTESLQAGQGIALIQQQFAGAAQGEIRTFSGALTQLQNTIGDTGESIGRLITDFPVVTALIATADDIFRDLTQTIDDNRDSAQAFIRDFLLTSIRSLPEFISLITGLGQSFVTLRNGIDVVQFIFQKFSTGILELSRQFAGLELAVRDFFELSTKETQRRLDVINSSIEASERQARSELDQARERQQAFEAVTRSAQEFASTVSEELTQSIKDAADADNAQTAQLLENSRKKQEATKAESEAVKELSETERKNAEERRKQIDDQLGLAAQSPASALLGGLPGVAAATPDEQGRVNRNRAIGGAAGLAGLAVGGAQGARNLVTGLAGGGLDLLAPGLGQALGPVLGALTQGPEAVRGLVNEFADQIPVIIDAFIEALPVLIDAIIDRLPDIIEALVDGVPKIIEALVENAPEIITSLVRSTPRIIAALIEGIPDIVTGFTVGLIEEIPKIVGGFVEELIKGAGRFVKRIIELIPGGGLITGGGGGLLGGIGDAIGFNRGGQGFVGGVPAGFPNDTFPARLTSGELVVDRTTARDLQAFLRTQSSTTGNGQEVVVRVEASDNFVTEIERRIIENRQLGTGLI